ncbi:hypothetical protein [Actinoplanes awajinensis]|uniref:Uncharacterized protein n=1 Tax=Actinoplanes awajinensis subsp. mycoplanecinus TaxID=135947 RepID=A0A0X3V774_9ACTN|nr:hypothetical protein [Actinoplanes awajinensis]KUL40082.1 hypothetical protein ADL15_08365 [Actinoplanes awajinensis subsp. mycoplanecinus]
MTTATPISSPPRAELPLWRLYLLRLGYLIVGGGLVAFKWPELLHHETPWPFMTSVVTCMLVAMSVFALLGLRYPLRLLPILLFEVAWKLIWLGTDALPLWLDHNLDADTWASTTEILWVVIPLAVIPWDHVFRTYVTAPAERWR